MLSKKRVSVIFHTPAASDSSAAGGVKIAILVNMKQGYWNRIALHRFDGSAAYW